MASWMGIPAAVLLVLAAVSAALGLPYLVAVVLALGALALVVGVPLLTSRSARKAYEALAAATGQSVAPREDDGGRWLGEHGFADLAGQGVSNFRVRRLEHSGGTVYLIEGHLGAGRNALWMEGGVFSARTDLPGAVCLYETGRGARLRAKLLGGAVATGTPIDALFIAFAASRDEAVAAAKALDADAVKGLFARVRALGAPEDLALAVRGGRVSLLVQEAPPSFFTVDTVREIMESLAVCGRTAR